MARAHALLTLDRHPSVSSDPPHPPDFAPEMLSMTNVRRFAALCLLGLAGLSGTAMAHEAQIRINCGGGSYVDTAGNLWSADINFTGGATYSTSTPIAGTDDDPLYQSERYGNNFGYQIPVADGTYIVTLHFAEIYFQQGGKRIFDVDAEGSLVLDDTDLAATVGGYAALTSSVELEVTDGTIDLQLMGELQNAKLSAIEVREPDVGHPFLHVVIDGDNHFVDYDLDGTVEVTLEGRDSHTHEIGHELTDFTWTLEGQVLGTSQDLTTALPEGTHQVTLTIEDDNTPKETLADSFQVIVDRIGKVRGAMTEYVSLRNTGNGGREIYRAGKEVLPGLSVPRVGGGVGNLSVEAPVRAIMHSRIQVRRPGQTYEFKLDGVRGRLFLDRQPYQGPQVLYPGYHELEVRMVIRDVDELPGQVLMKINNGAFEPIPEALLSHEQDRMGPFVNPFQETGSSFGGQTLEIPGLGFYPPDQVELHWGNQVFMEPDIQVTPNQIVFQTPPGSGVLPVMVRTPQGDSNFRGFAYEDTGAPISFVTNAIASKNDPTQLVWGPDGRLYVGSLDGSITVYSFDDDYAVTAVQTVSTLTSLSNPFILGMAFNPQDPCDPPRLYVAHSQLFANGGACFTGTSPYSGQVSMLEGPLFDTVTPLITGLPVSNHDHAVNGMEFDEAGDLYVLVGGNTNAGVEACPIGGIPESPLSAALIRARLSKPGFYGVVEYMLPGGALNDDQVFGDVVDLVPGVDLEIVATGLRNSWDMAYTTRGEFYATDNGPNAGFGAESLDAFNEGPDPAYMDKLLLLTDGHYYGHPNRNRGRTSVRENTYRNPDATAELGQYTSPLAAVGSSVNGIAEYRASTFDGAMRGKLIYQKWSGKSYCATLESDGRSILGIEEIAGGPQGLDLIPGPGGAILGTDYSGDEITVSLPVDPMAFDLTVYDVFPWRGKADGTVPFVIGGAHFGSLAETEVRIGGQLAVLTSVSSNRIRGFIPASASPTAELLDIEVTDTSTSTTELLEDAFRYVLPPHAGQGTWESGPSAPQALGEVAAGIIDGILYLVGEDSDVTLAYDLATQQWHDHLARRPHPGNHHGAEVIDGKLYLFGGFSNNSAGKVQIYDPLTDSWSLGTDMPFATGSASTALIGGLVYVAGGIVLGSTVTDTAVYDPVADTWTSLAPMPVGRNHAAAGTDGQKLFIFGGRGPGSGDSNAVAEGFDETLVYDPVTDTWESSADLGSTLPALPQKRGGTGRAAYFQGEFYVMGGETTSGGVGAIAGNVYDRVDVFDPVAETWRTEAITPTGRHGIYPVVHGNRLIVAGGGVVAGHSSSAILEVFRR